MSFVRVGGSQLGADEKKSFACVRVNAITLTEAQ